MAAQRGKNGAHAAQCNEVHILFVQPKRPADLCADGAAELQRCALTSGGAAAKMGDDGADENERRKEDGYAIFAAHGVDHGVGAGVFQVRQLVDSGDEQSAERQQKQQPRLIFAQRCHLFNADVKRCADQSADGARERSEDDPFQQREYIVPRAQ